MSNGSPPTSLSLLERLRDQRDADAWHKLSKIYSPLVHAWLRSAALQAADRDDLSQQILQVLCRKIERFQHNGQAGAFRAWLHAITRNVLRDYYRTRRTETAASAVLDQLADPDSELSRRWSQDYSRHVVQSLLELMAPEFSTSTMQAFRRLVLDEVPAGVVGQELGMTVNAVLIAKSRVLARLRQEGHGLID